jgi:hypothetical protein
MSEVSSRVPSALWKLCDEDDDSIYEGGARHKYE